MPEFPFMGSGWSRGNRAEDRVDINPSDSGGRRLLMRVECLRQAEIVKAKIPGKVQRRARQQTLLDRNKSHRLGRAYRLVKRLAGISVQA